MVQTPVDPSIEGSENRSDGVTLDFPHGLPGFETSTRFVLRERPSFAPVALLQSADSEDLCFLVAPVAALVQRYSICATPEDLRALGLDDSSQPEPSPNLLCLAILTAPEGGPLTANLLAPVVINLATHIAVQAVRQDCVYSHRFAITAIGPVAPTPPPDSQPSSLARTGSK